MQIARSNKFEKQYKKLSAKVQAQFAQRLRMYLKDETAAILHVHSLTGKYRGTKSFNVNADIRVVFEIKDDEILHLIAVGSHSQLYR